METDFEKADCHFWSVASGLVDVPLALYAAYPKSDLGVKSCNIAVVAKRVPYDLAKTIAGLAGDPLMFWTSSVHTPDHGVVQIDSVNIELDESPRDALVCNIRLTARSMGHFATSRPFPKRIAAHTAAGERIFLDAGGDN